MVHGDEPCVLIGEESLFLQHGFEAHALMATEKGEHHVKVYERLRFVGQFLHQYMKGLSLTCEGLCQVLYSLGVGTYALAYTQQVGRCYLHVAPFGARLAVPPLSTQRVYTEEMSEDALIEVCLAFAHLKTHTVDEHTVIECRRGIACEEQVVKRVQQIAVIALSVPFWVFKTLYKHLGQSGGRQVA